MKVASVLKTDVARHFVIDEAANALPHHRFSRVAEAAAFADRNHSHPRR
jgi:hypothetical protein